MRYLRQVIYTLPDIDQSFKDSFIRYLAPLGEIKPDGVRLRLSNGDFLPATSFSFSQVAVPHVNFCFSDQTVYSIEISNTTGQSRNSPHMYDPITIEEFIRRVSPFTLFAIDHTGFNLPSFEGVHPKIVELREKSSASSLYHTFPRHIEDAEWDFILPATEEEINRSTATDYSINRKPKLELVSFDTSSTPLIQIDIQLVGHYEGWEQRFPEAIPVPALRSLWVYLQNSFGIDVCFVLNEVDEKDWSHHFVTERI